MTAPSDDPETMRRPSSSIARAKTATCQRAQAASLSPIFDVIIGAPRDKAAVGERHHAVNVVRVPGQFLTASVGQVQQLELMGAGAVGGATDHATIKQWFDAIDWTRLRVMLCRHVQALGALEAPAVIAQGPPRALLCIQPPRGCLA